MRFRASDVADATGGRLVGPDVDLDGASFDSRSVEPGQLFVPIVAERDGHEFVDAALAAGAGGYLTARGASGGTAIEVADTAAALMSLAAWARRRSSAEVVGITGSVGKTSTKDLVAGAVGAARRVTANARSYNNEQGLPVTILDAPDDTEVLVLEMGMRGFDEIRRLCAVAEPSIGVVTAVGHSHTERLGGIDGVALAKRELVEALPAAGTAILNADDPRVAGMALYTEADVVTFGAGASADVRVSHLELDELARPRFQVTTPWGRADVALSVSGAHMALNTAAALAVAGVLGVPLDDAVATVGATTLTAMRMDLRHAPSGAIVINDAYNANPTSMRAALDALAAVRAERRVAVLGAMGELDDVEGGHREVAELAASLGIELIAVATDLYGVAPAADPVASLGLLGEGDVVLVKASRASSLDRLAAELLGEERLGG